MGKFIDLTGKQFGKLKVIKRDKIKTDLFTGFVNVNVAMKKVSEVNI